MLLYIIDKYMFVIHFLTFLSVVSPEAISGTSEISKYSSGKKETSQFEINSNKKPKIS